MRESIRKNPLFLLRISLSIVYVWFGVLKVLGISPVHNLIVSTYPTFPEPQFLVILGIWEIVIGVGLLMKNTLKFALPLLWLQMSGIFFGVFLAPHLYFLSNNPFLLTANGEFVVKNFVLVAASIVIWKKEL